MKKLLILLLTLPLLAAAQVKPITSKAVSNPDLLWDLKALSVPPKVEWLDTSAPIHSLLYSSVEFRGKPTQVFAWYSNPDLLNGRKSNKKYPAVVLAHGGGGKAYKEWVELWAAKGYAAIAMDLYGNGADGKKLPAGGPDQSDQIKAQPFAEGRLKDVWTHHATADVILAHSFLLDLPEVDPKRTGITGISWGGYLTCIAASLDNRFKIAVPVYGCGYYDESDVFKTLLSGLSASQQSTWMKYFDPSSYLSTAEPKFLFLNGNKDLHYNVMPYHKTYSQVPVKRRFVSIKPDMPHSHVDGWAPKEILSFFDEEFVYKKPHAKVQKVLDAVSSIKLSYRSPVAIQSADFYYSNDMLSKNVDRKWQKINAVVDIKKKIVTVEKPKEGFKYGFFQLLNEENISISSEFIIN
jgi:hypothetical protein